jgi:TM2 domain-containing membrane protein YozV
MNKAIKAALLSSLVFPGLGQFLLKKYYLGGLLAGIAFISFAVILANIVQRSLLIAEQIEQGEIPFDVMTISALILEQQSISSGTSIVSIASIVLILTWIISIIDSIIAK